MDTGTRTSNHRSDQNPSNWEYGSPTDKKFVKWQAKYYRRVKFKNISDQGHCQIVATLNVAMMKRNEYKLEVKLERLVDKLILLVNRAIKFYSDVPKRKTERMAHLFELLLFSSWIFLTLAIIFRIAGWLINEYFVVRFVAYHYSRRSIWGKTCYCR